MQTDCSKRAFDRAKAVLPGGVNSPVRSFKSVGGVPRFIQRGQGSHVVDADWNEYVDYVGSWGPLICGHAHPEVVNAIARAATSGTSFGAPTENETRLAERIIGAMPSIEKLRLVNSGTEAVMSAIRLARGATGRDRIIKMAGGYHGHVDQLLVEAGSGVATLAIPGCAGVPKSVAELTIVVPYNDADAVAEVFKRFPDDIAAVLVEPVAGNMGVVPPMDGYLQQLRALCDRHGALLIFDEVITGFRVAWGGAQERFGVQPDLTCLGKIIGGGLPVGAYGGRAALMDHLAPIGPVYQAGTLSGNPIAVAAGLATLDILSQPGTYDQLETTASRLANGLLDAAKMYELVITINRVGSMMTLFFSPGPIRNYDDVMHANAKQYTTFFHAMLERHIYLAPSAFEAAFVSLAHSENDLQHTLVAARKSLLEMASPEIQRKFQ